ncbi:MAG: thymidine phosphorylase [Clostridiales bacterium]|nr:thymidine phosphorylase [Clostridiales bacterium]
MRMYDIIKNKRDGLTLSSEEIAFFVRGFTDGSIPDYQASALMMAIYFNGMEERETFDLTMMMTDSGDRVDLSKIKGITADKHSTGGVGDKTSLIIAPICAACGVRMAKMSGRGLGHTGGTIDKLESIPGYKTTVDPQDFVDIVNKIGLSIIGQSGDLAPADKLLYAQRDVTATVDSIPLIASSIMSKKLAAGAECIMLDVKTGSGAFMKTTDAARELAKAMIAIGRRAGRKMAALITDMDVPLGRCIGNALEVIEAVDVLKGNGRSDLVEICLALSAGILEQSLNLSEEDSLAAARRALEDGSAYDRFLDMVKAHGGDLSFIKDTSKFRLSPHTREITALKEGYISRIDTEKCGLASLLTGAGRSSKSDSIDFGAGIRLHKTYGESLKKGEPYATLYAGSQDKLDAAEKMLQSAVTISETPPPQKTLIIDRL